MNILNLLWIVPASMVIGALAITAIACAIRASDTSQEEEKRNEK
jgi:hypothetical protein